MIWGSIAEFLTMGGFAPYVWGSLGVCALVMVAEPILLRRRRTQALHELRREIAARAENS